MCKWFTHLNSRFRAIDKFTQSSKTKTVARGTGLDLAICHEIIKAQDGRIWVENNPESRLTFSFLLPYQQYPFKNGRASRDRSETTSLNLYTKVLKTLDIL